MIKRAGDHDHISLASSCDDEFIEASKDSEKIETEEEGQFMEDAIPPPGRGSKLRLTNIYQMIRFRTNKCRLRLVTHF